MALKDYTAQELYNELHNRIGDEIFDVNMWVRKDVEDVFPNKTEEEVTRFMDENHGYFHDRTTELGYEVMHDLDW